jgi:hypothetical protein
MDSTPRKLTTHQKAVLIQVLLTFPNQQATLYFMPHASDALAYAQDFQAVFKAIGWTVNDPEPDENLSRRCAGLALLSSERNLPPCAEAFRDALRIYGIEAETFCDPACRIAPGGFALVIGLAGDASA